ncbi:MAG: NAD(P)H-dependent oxidoreductase subunit E [Oscillospiraceae bacterium]|nr:NAD(P)H-dependent oxidoreductase subunit E [Oscillospiraceae bacterium]
MKDAATLTETTAEQLAKVAEIASAYADRPDMLMHVVTETQKVVRALSEDVVEVIAREMHTSKGRVYSFITFYAMMSTKPTGKYIIRMCKSSPCHVVGAREILDTVMDFLDIQPDETTADGLFTLEHCPCIGLCDQAPAMLINETPYGNLTPEGARQILREYMQREAGCAV